MNKTVLIGRLTKDPELRFLPGNGTAVSSFTLAVDRKFKKEGYPEADFIPIVAWGKTAEAIANYMTKGKLIAVDGRIQTRNYEAADGTRRYVTEIIAESVQFLESKNQNNNQTRNQNNNQNKNNNPNDFDFLSDVTPIDDGEIPF